MKVKFILFTIVLGFIVSSCHDLDLEPKGILGEPELFGTEFGVKKYFTGIYNYLPIEDFLYYARPGNAYNNPNTGYRSGNYWEAGKFNQGNMSGEFFNTWLGVNNNGFGYWPYARIRIVNTFIQNFPNYADKYEEAEYNALLGEAHFFRAFFYMGLAKRYGGVPIVTEVQDPLGDAEELAVSRATEYDTWKFIHDDLQFAIDNMKASSEAGRANKWAAAALMSRAMLYAGSIAKYTQYLGFGSESAVQAGVAGMDPADADEFFQYAYDVSKMIIDEGPYSLYNKESDKALNFANLFIDGTSPENIFIKDFDRNAPGNTRLRHTWDALMSPSPDMSSFVGAESYPPLDFMKMYEFPDIVDGSGNPVRFDSRSDIKNNMEPRLRGTVFFDGDELRGKTFSIQRGIYLSYNGTAADAQDGSNNAPINSPDNRILGRTDSQPYNGVSITGRHGVFEDRGGENNCITGAFIRKYVNPNVGVNDVSVYTSGQHWIVFRLGEIYMNLAEAAYELDQKSEALDYVEVIRERAGCQVTRTALDQTTSSILGYPIEATLQYIRDERERELYGENHWWWDLRRWRVVDQVLSNWIPRSLSAYYVFDEDKFIFLDEANKFNRSWSASKSAMYEPIPQDEINKNPNLLPQNPLH